MESQVGQVSIVPGSNGEPPMVRYDGPDLTGADDVALVGRAMMQSAAYLFAKGQPVQFGAEIPREVLR